MVNRIKSVIKMEFMFKNKKMQYLIYKIIFFCFLIINSSAFAGPPYQTDDPETVEVNNYEIYLYTLLDKNHFKSEEPQLQAPVVELNWGLIENLQLHIAVPYVWSLPSAARAAHGKGDIELGVKYRFVEETTYIPQIGVFPYLEVPTGNVKKNLGNGKPLWKLPIWLQKSYGEWKTYGGVGYIINHAPDARNCPYAGWMLQKDLSDRLTIGAELYYQGAVATDTHSYTFLNPGGYYKLSKHLSVLFSGGRSIAGERHIVGYLGLYWNGELM